MHPFAIFCYFLICFHEIVMANIQQEAYVSGDSWEGWFYSTDVATTELSVVDSAGRITVNIHARNDIQGAALRYLNMRLRLDYRFISPEYGIPTYKLGTLDIEIDRHDQSIERVAVAVGGSYEYSADGSNVLITWPLGGVSFNDHPFWDLMKITTGETKTGTEAFILSDQQIGQDDAIIGVKINNLYTPYGGGNPHQGIVLAVIGPIGRSTSSTSIDAEREYVVFTACTGDEKRRIRLELIDFTLNKTINKAMLANSMINIKIQGI